MQRLLVHRIQTNCNQSYDHAYHLYGDTLRKHWIDRNIYPISSKRVKREVKILLDNFWKFKNVALLRRNDKWKGNVKAFATENKELFDIFCGGKM